MKAVATSLLQRHEGLRLKPYRCTAGKLTIGYGRNLEDVGISETEADMLLESDIARAIQGAQSFIRNWGQLNEVRQAVLVDMAFNLGEKGLQQFTSLRAALEQSDFAAASRAMQNSLWARQVPTRAKELVALMRHGVPS